MPENHWLDARDEFYLDGYFSIPINVLESCSAVHLRSTSEKLLKTIRSMLLKFVNGSRAVLTPGLLVLHYQGESSVYSAQCPMK